MKYYSYFKYDPDLSKQGIVTLSEKEILDQNWEWWKEKMIKKYGKTYFEEQFSEKDCIFDWVIDNWAREEPMKLSEEALIELQK